MLARNLWNMKVGARTSEASSRRLILRAPDAAPLRKQGERVNIWSPRGADFTYRFPVIAAAVRGLAGDSALIDGEAKRLKQLEDENATLKKLLAEQMLDAAALRELLSKKW
jgi:hypothetical protein